MSLPRPKKDEVLFWVVACLPNPAELLVLRERKVSLMKYDDRARDNQWKCLRADFVRFRQNGLSGWGSEGFWTIAVYRLQKISDSGKPKWIWAPARLILGLLKKVLTLLTHMSIDYEARIGPGLFIAHCGPIRVHGDTTIGADCTLHHVCTIGAGAEGGGATIGDHVWMGCHCSIIGRVTIGDNATIMPNSLVISDVPAGTTVIGVPARIMPAARRTEVLIADEAGATSSQRVKSEKLV
jgi:serine O-acetyltransferase